MPLGVFLVGHSRLVCCIEILLFWRISHCAFRNSCWRIKCVLVVVGRSREPGLGHSCEMPTLLELA